MFDDVLGNYPRRCLCWGHSLLSYVSGQGCFKRIAFTALWSLSALASLTPPLADLCGLLHTKHAVAIAMHSVKTYSRDNSVV